ncbi:peptide-N4-asparagine amidase A [Streptomyces roseirectus]|uniref:Peptide-N4-asparagine amidase A n=2 Tax=Streptomyces roseirectus TaxID=2768066 RepID=A0A7H0ITD9_9ACTN|nr:peptide-N4-asparagine amidase A [Streptomyces roseirectus]
MLAAFAAAALPLTATAHPAQAADPAQPADSAQASVPTRATAPATDAPPVIDAPPVFGSDWHDPLTAAPPVPKPGTKSCEVTVAQAQFRDFTPYRGTYTPPAACGTDWSKVVLRLDGKVKGRQYDRLGSLHVGGVEIYRTSTPQPSPDGIEWSVEKDVTRYTDTLRRAQDVEMLIGNVVDETYTGVLDVKVTLTFHKAPASHKSPETQGTSRTSVPDKVLTLTPDHTLTTPRNSERILAEVYATGSGGGCEEYWYLSVPAPAPYSCQTPDGPYREVRITVDGRLAGIATPFPTVWTGGWSNPFLWYVVPGPRAFDIKPIEYDLTPFAGLLNDGRPHRVEVSVVGVPEGQTGWSAPVNVLVWQDAGKQRVGGKLTVHKEGAPTGSSTYTPGTEHRVDTRAGHSLTVAGYLDTSHGRVTTTVARTLAHTSAHRWTDGESTDALDGVWRDDETVVVNGHATRAHRTYTMDGETTIGADARLRTVMTLADRAAVSDSRGRWSRLDDTYTGDAAYTTGVPRDQRQGVATTTERYRLTGSGGCYDRTVTAVQGVLTGDSSAC